MDVPHLRVKIGEKDIVEGAKKLLPAFRPDWDINSVRFKIFTDGITNKLLGCFNGCQENDDVVLIRVYGNKTDLLIDRKAETRNFKLLNAAGLAPRLYATFDSGLVYEYVAGDVVTADKCLLDEKVYTLIARTMADMHCVRRRRGEDAEEPVLWTTLRRFLDLVPKRFSRPPTEARFDELFEKRPSLEEELAFLRDNLSSLDSPVVFCHNDLLLGNIVYNSRKDSVTFIDYEYAGCNYQAYDIANHFNEFAGVENVDYSLFPDRAYQIRWLRVYLDRFRSCCGGDDDDDDDSARRVTVESLYESVQKFTLASHFLWGVWALIQAENSSIDFDFVHYAFVRFNEYFARKARVFER